jgi:mono/diheme cytochrome c family protein
LNVRVRARCGASDCHLRPVGGYAAGPDPGQNLRSAIAFSIPGDGAGSHLLRIAVPVARGGLADALAGTHHARGGTVFATPESDADYRAIRAWIDAAREGPGISVGEKPDALALSADERTLLVANPFGSSISVVDLAGLREVRRIHTQSVVTALATHGRWLIAAGLGAGFGAPKGPDPGGRESLDRDNPAAEFSLWRDPDTGRPWPIERQKVLGPFAHTDGTAQMKFRDISNDLIVIDLEAEARAAPAGGGPGWSLDVSRYAATPAYTRYAADTFEALFGDVHGDVAPELLRVAGAHPEQIALDGDRLLVVNAGSFDVAEYRLDLAAPDPARRLVPAGSHETDLHPRGLALVPGGRLVLTANIFGESLSIIERATRRRRDVPLGGATPRFPSTDAERGELFVETSILSVDGDQSCVHCHYRDAGDGRAWSVSQTMGTDRSQTRERTGGSQKVPSCVRNLLAQVPFFVEGTLSIDEPLTMIMEQNPLLDFAGSTPRGDYTRVFCPPELEAQLSRSADAIITAAPLGGRKLPPDVRLVDLAYRRDLHFRAITRRYWGREYGIRDIQKFVGDFQAIEPRLLPNPLAQAAAGDEDLEVARGREVFFNPEVGCASCHPPPHFTLKDGVYNQNRSLPPLVSPNPRDDAHTLVSAHRQDRNVGFQRHWGTGDAGRVEENEGFYTTPSLRGVWAAPPVLLHHGQARSLREVVCSPGHPSLRRLPYPPRGVTAPRTWERGMNEIKGLPDTHGQTSHLGYRDMNALVRYLQSIE